MQKKINVILVEIIITERKEKKVKKENKNVVQRLI